MQDWNLADQIAGQENAGLENAGPEMQDWKVQDQKKQDKTFSIFAVRLSFVHCRGISYC